MDSVIIETTSLQYKIELGMAGYEDGSSSSNVISRLAAIRRERYAWRHLFLKYVKTITIPSQEWIEARSHKDVISGRVPDLPKQLELVYLGRGISDQDRIKHIEFGTRFDVHYIDPGQDLVVLASLSQTLDAAGMRPSPRVYLCSLQDQKPHPRAKQSFIDLASYGFPAASFVRRAKIQVSGEYLAFTVQKSLAVEAIFVWHWPSGTILAVSYCLPLPHEYHAHWRSQALRSSPDTAYLTAFCTADGHLLVNVYERNARHGFGIHVYALHTDEEIPTLIATFQLPWLKWDFSSWLNCTFFPGYQKHSQLAGPIAAGPMDFHPTLRLVQLRVDLQYTVYTLLTTFLSPAVLEDRHRRSPLRYPWSAWGPRSARVLHEEIESIVCGFKAIYPDHVLDFCPVTDLAGDEDDSVIRTETVIETTVFAEKVTTRLPFRKVPLPFEKPLSRNQMQLFFRDVDGPKVGTVCPRLQSHPSNVDADRARYMRGLYSHSNLCERVFYRIRQRVGRIMIVKINFIAFLLGLHSFKDLATYPRTLPHDLEVLQSLAMETESGTHKPSAVFVPTVYEMYPAGISQNVAEQKGTFVEVKGFSHQMEGKTRPTFFRGVATVVTKLFNVIEPTRTYFGQKDIQQAFLLRRMARDLLLSHPTPENVHIVPTARDPMTLLALSSRNTYLTPQEREVAAPTLYAAFAEGRKAWAAGSNKAECIAKACSVVSDKASALAREDIDT
ncbi:uncharacterized protein PHACADRAFT_188161 [Phanerochaete carnosa HHB-10118-sp]|uniref:Pantoate--beta-alanine ligase n=1 Tax=Phanerochaete carnosa (strain HHB-10118-sp) TaxID=650164 RepID=K5ULQ8_PHACS|nr:uncharacterized protein PHACADRAFT_188161 [Phanerochaete carnosa HHB-10118-sp]EKM50616.1 hypothetical protein PHACADRAFT_188161 [Phanerochaete carnosa HHB-10118-sp]